MIHFTRPIVLLLLLALPLWWWLRRRRREPIPYGDVSLAAEMPGAAWRHRLPPILRGLALAAWIIAASGPESGGSTVEQKREGIAIVIAIDISSSMLAEDFAPSNRLEVAKRQAISFVRGREADRIGLVAFAGEALTQVPITLDYDVVQQSIEGLRIGSLEDGTAIGSGLATSVNRLRRAEGKSRVVLLLTDGENTEGVAPLDATANARDVNVPVFTIGMGGRGGGLPFGGGGARGSVDETLLQEMAAQTGGQYYYAPSGGDLQRIYNDLGVALGWDFERLEIGQLVGGAAVFVAGAGLVLAFLWLHRQP